ncbi:MAG: hypothetical protein JXA52_08310 [Planctomycetes bacterium]|nr:hypothetical protein [Planctomycetota bacterium]
MKPKVLLSFFLFTMLIASFAFTAQSQEQWLKYRTSTRPSLLIGPSRGQNASFVTTPPEGLALPQFSEHRPPIFFKWRMAYAPGGYSWMALDASKKGAFYDRLYLDWDLDGEIADEEPIMASEARTMDNHGDSKFIARKIMLPGGDGPNAYYFTVYCYDFGNDNTSVGCNQAGWYEENIIIDGQSTRCAVIDNDGNGVFNDCNPDFEACDIIRLAVPGERPIPDCGGFTYSSYQGRYLELDSKLYETEIAADGSNIKISPAENPEMGKLQLDPGIKLIEIFGKSGYYAKKPKDGMVELPAGEYRLYRYEMSRTGVDGKDWQIRQDVAYHEDLFTVKTGETTQLSLGEPFKCVVEAEKRGKGYDLNLSLKTAKGDDFLYLREGERPPAPKLHIKNEDGTYEHTYPLEYG